jgi:hypothetical protein
MSNEANITIDDARALVADEALWPRMRDFLWDFAPQIHASWLEGLGPETESFMSSPRVKRFVLSSLGVQPCFHDFPKGDWSRLLLLDGPTLGAIAKWLGAIACVDSLRRVTDGATVRSLKSSMPGVYPDVFGFTAYFKGLEISGAGAEDAASGGRRSVAEDVVSTGVSILVAILAPLHESLVARLRLKLPKGLCEAAPLRLKPEPCGKALAKLLKLKFPEAYRLCC